MSPSRRCPQCDAPLADDAPEGLCPACLMQQGLETEPGGGPQNAHSAGAAADHASGHRARFALPKPDQLQQHFPQLEILDLIGQGGMGAVYRARQKGLDRIVALKILPPEVGREPAFAERFTREAKALARLNHPNIVAVHDVGQSGGLFYFIMEYVDGLNLRQAMQAGQLSPREAMAIVPQVCDALQYAHDEGIVHRDIKPENILLDKKGRVKIADFGLAKLLGHAPADHTLTQQHQVMGTPRYMAPEQMEQTASVDHRADIYSLGVVFYEMLTGEVPMGRFAPPSQKVQVDVRLDEVVLRSLEREPQRRFQKVSEVKTQVETITSTPPEKAAAAPAPHGHRRKQHSAVAVIVALALCLVFCCLPIALPLLLFFSWTSTYRDTRQEAFDRAQMQIDSPVYRDAASSQVLPERIPVTPPRTAAVWDVLQFRVVPNIGEDARQPSLSQAEYDDLKGKLETNGPQPPSRQDRFGWFELGPEVEASNLPTATANTVKYVLLCLKSDQMEAMPEDVSIVGRPYADEHAVPTDPATVQIELGEDDGQKMEALTTANLENRLAVLVRGKVISAPKIRSRIGRQAQITSGATLEQAERLVEAMKHKHTHDEPGSQPTDGGSEPVDAGQEPVEPESH